MSKKQSISKKGTWEVIMYDDELIHVDHVIDCLLEICGHGHIQAVQCTYLVHHKGQCSIYTNQWDICNEVLRELLEEGLTVTLSKCKKS